MSKIGCKHWRFRSLAKVLPSVPNPCNSPFLGLGQLPSLLLRSPPDQSVWWFSANLAGPLLDHRPTYFVLVSGTPEGKCSYTKGTLSSLKIHVKRWDHPEQYEENRYNLATECLLPHSLTTMFQQKTNGRKWILLGNNWRIHPTPDFSKQTFS